MSSKNSSKADEYIRLGMQSIEKKDISKAIKHFEKAVKIQPTRLDIWFNIASFYERLGKKKKSLKTYDKIKGIFQDNTHFWMLYGEAFQKVGEHEKAIDAFKKSIDINPDNAVCLHQQGFSYSQLGKKQFASVCFEKAVKIDPDQYISYISLGDVYYSAGKYEEAEKAYQEALKKIPSKIGPTTSKEDMLLLLLEEAKKMSEIDTPYNDYLKQLLNEIDKDVKVYTPEQMRKAVQQKLQEIFKKIIGRRLSPEYIETIKDSDKLIKISEHLADTNGDPRLRLKALFRALEFKPEWLRAWAQIGAVYNQIGEHVNAIHYFKKILEKDDKAWDILYFIGCTYADFSDFKRGLEYLQKSASINNTPTVQRDIAEATKAFHFKKNIQNQQKENHDKLEKHRVNPEFQQKVSQANSIGELNELEKETSINSPENKAVLMRKIELDSKDTRALSELGMAMSMYGLNISEGTEYLRDLVEIEWNVAYNWFLLAMALERAGEFDNALLAIKRAIELKPDDEGYKGLYQRIQGTKMAARAFLGV